MKIAVVVREKRCGDGGGGDEGDAMEAMMEIMAVALLALVEGAGATGCAGGCFAIVAWLQAQRDIIASAGVSLPSETTRQDRLQASAGQRERECGRYSM